MSTENETRARVAVALLEHAAGLLAAAANEGPKREHSIGVAVADLNRSIHALQNRLLPLADPIRPAPRRNDGQ